MVPFIPDSEESFKEQVLDYIDQRSKDPEPELEPDATNVVAFVSARQRMINESHRRNLLLIVFSNLVEALGTRLRASAQIPE